jgi:hypothetical protein
MAETIWDRYRRHKLSQYGLKDLLNTYIQVDPTTGLGWTDAKLKKLRSHYDENGDGYSYKAFKRLVKNEIFGQMNDDDESRVKNMFSEYAYVMDNHGLQQWIGDDGIVKQDGSEYTSEDINDLITKYADKPRHQYILQYPQFLTLYDELNKDEIVLQQAVRNGQTNSDSARTIMSYLSDASRMFPEKKHGVYKGERGLFPKLSGGKSKKHKKTKRRRTQKRRTPKRR